MSSKLVRNLKTLFKDYFYDKTEDETNFHTWISENSSYTDGVLKIQSIGVQTYTLNLWRSSGSAYTGILECTLSPAVAGQNVEFIMVNRTVNTTTDVNGYCNSGANVFRPGVLVRIVVDAVEIDGVSYEPFFIEYQVNWEDAS